MGGEGLNKPGFASGSPNFPLLISGCLCALPRGQGEGLWLRGLPTPCLERAEPGPAAQPLALTCIGGRGGGERGELTVPLPARRQSGSFLSTGWFTMILALELCEEIVVYGMVSDSYCRSGRPGPGREERPGLGGLWAPCLASRWGSCGARDAWAP